MLFRLKVTLNGIKGFYRIYHVHGATTLYTLHKQLRADMEFPQDQLIMFKALAADPSPLYPPSLKLSSREEDTKEESTKLTSER